MSQVSESLLVVGTGALASLFAARSVRAGLPVGMLGGWQEGVKAIRKGGLHFMEVDGSEDTFRVQVYDSPEACQGVTHALILVKSWQTERSARQLGDCLAADGVVLTLQNGLGNQEILESHLGSGRVFTGVTTLGATLLGPGRVRAGGEGVIYMPENPRLQPFWDWFRVAGFSPETSADMQGLVWGKLVINAAINPLTALLGVTNGELLKISTARTLMRQAAQEVAAVANVKGIRLPFGDPVAAVEEVARKTAANRSSMLQDIQRGAPTENEAICGAVVRAGSELDMATPVNETLYNLVKSLVEVKKRL